jgi:hypothetical protein
MATRSGADAKRTWSLTGVDGGGYGSPRLDVGGPAHGERDGEVDVMRTDRGTMVKLAHDGARLTPEDRGSDVSPGDGDPTRRR